MMTSPSQNLNIKGRHGGFDVRAGGDEKQKINFAWPYAFFYLFFGKINILLMQLGEEGQGNRQASPTPTHEPHIGDQVHTCQQN